jgi:acyl-CoA synthetase (AMP-forming)/AMP-acid ligase II
VRRPGSGLDAETLLAHCRARLPKHMVPDLIEFVDQLPLNSSGKVVKRDVRDRLRELVAARSVPA